MEPSGLAEFGKFMKAVLVVGLGLFVYGVYCLVQSPRVHDQAQRVTRMTCDDLVRNGPGPNRYVALTDAALNLGGHSVSERDSDTGALEMYHPFHPARLQQEPEPRDFRLILGVMDEGERRRIRDDGNYRKQAGQLGLSELTGEVTEGSKLPAWAHQGFAQEYPGIPVDKCWVVTVGRYEPTLQRADRLQRHGIGATLCGSLLIFGWWVWRRTLPTPLIESAPPIEIKN